MAKDWKALQDLAASIEQLLAPQGAVVKISDRTLIDLHSPKHRRPEVDVSIKFQVGSVPILITVECRDRRRKEGSEWIEQLGKKKEALGANATIAVSTGGFTSGAKEKAALYGIELRHVESIKDANVSDWFKTMRATVGYAAYKVVRLGLDWAEGHDINEGNINISLADAWNSPVFLEGPDRKPVSVSDLLAEWWGKRQRPTFGIGESKDEVIGFVPDPGTLYYRHKNRDHEISRVLVHLEVGHYRETVPLDKLHQYSNSLGVLAYAGQGKVTTGLDKPLDFVVVKEPESPGFKVIVRHSDEPIQPKEKEPGVQ